MRATAASAAIRKRAANARIARSSPGQAMPVNPSPVAERFGGVPFDIENVFWSHRGDTCTFDTMIEEFALGTPPLLRLATMVRGADTARPELSPPAPGLLAASLGLSRMYSDDLEQLEAGMLLYDALYRWSRDATNETTIGRPISRGPEMNANWGMIPTLALSCGAGWPCNFWGSSEQPVIQ